MKIVMQMCACVRAGRTEAASKSTNKPVGTCKYSTPEAPKAAAYLFERFVLLRSHTCSSSSSRSRHISISLLHFLLHLLPMRGSVLFDEVDVGRHERVGATLVLGGVARAARGQRGLHLQRHNLKQAAALRARGGNGSRRIGS